MSRQLEAAGEQRGARRIVLLEKTLGGGLVDVLQHQGVELLGFAAKWDAWDCLITLRADVDGVRSVAFVGSDTLINCLVKCGTDANREKLRWRPDKYAGGRG